MKKLIVLALLMGSFSVSAQQKQKPQVVEVACGECKFGMKGKGCDLAVRIDGKPYFLDGVKIDDHGDAHADDGFCNAVRKAEVTGSIQGDHFKATSFKLLPLKAKAKK